MSVSSTAVLFQGQQKTVCCTDGEVRVAAQDPLPPDTRGGRQAGTAVHTVTFVTHQSGHTHVPSVRARVGSGFEATQRNASRTTGHRAQCGRTWHGHVLDGHAQVTDGTATECAMEDGHGATTRCYAGRWSAHHVCSEEGQWWGHG